MKNEKRYESPKLKFEELQLFENVAEKCWADPNQYILIDPTTKDSSFNLSGLPIKNGCNDIQKQNIIDHLKKTDEYKLGTLTDDDIDTILDSGGGNMGTPLKTSQYIFSK